MATEVELIQLSYTVVAKVGNETCLANVASNEGILEVIPNHLFLMSVNFFSKTNYENEDQGLPLQP